MRAPHISPYFGQALVYGDPPGALAEGLDYFLDTDRLSHAMAAARASNDSHA
jgi:hypothetical protein